MEPLNDEQKKAALLINNTAFKTMDIVQQYCIATAQSFGQKIIPLSILKLSIDNVKKSLSEGAGLSIEEIERYSNINEKNKPQGGV